MRVRWRLATAAVQLLVLVVGSRFVVGQYLVADAWFISGILLVVLATQLTEPFFPKPGDALASCVATLAVILLANKEQAEVGWYALAAYAASGLLVAVLALSLGAGREEGPGLGIARAARQLTGMFSGRIIYFALFVVAAYESAATDPDQFLSLLIIGAAVVSIGAIKWDRLYENATGRPTQGRCLGLLAPSRALIATADAPPVGTPINIDAGKIATKGHIVSRTRRQDDYWCEIQVSDKAAAENLTGRSVRLSYSDNDDTVLGTVEAGTGDRQLIFTPTAAVHVGGTAAVRVSTPEEREILYQIVNTEVVEDRPGPQAAQLVIRATAAQLGHIDQQGRLLVHRWTPEPGSLVRSVANKAHEAAQPPDTWMKLGNVLDSDVPVFLDLPLAITGHLAILGMTKMGKSTLTVRLASKLKEWYPVIVIDQTGEYRQRHGFPGCTEQAISAPGVCVREVTENESGPQTALKALQKLESLGRSEYENGELRSRVLILEEAHQFVPEPSMLGFGAPGRDESIQFGLLMMQVRKFGISVIIVSQRTAVVAKSALSQCENILAFRSVDQTGLDYIEGIGGSSVRQLVPRLRQGEIVAMGPALSSENAAAIALARPEDQ